VKNEWIGAAKQGKGIGIGIGLRLRLGIGLRRINA
jgi:hypothetical protein